MNIFNYKKTPSISIEDYINHIKKYSIASNESYILASIYRNRICKKTPINSYNIHRLFLTSLVIASKYWDDNYYSNAFYSKVGGISLLEMNDLEMNFLFLIKFNLSE